MEPIRKIVVPVDFSAHSRAALEYAIDFAKQIGAEIHVIHAFSMPLTTVAAYEFAGAVAAVPPNLWADLESAASQNLEAFVGEADAKGVPVKSRLVIDIATKAILDFAENVDADLIIMGTRGLTGLKHVALGSVAERTLRSAACPVLTLKTGDD